MHAFDWIFVFLGEGRGSKLNEVKMFKNRVTYTIRATFQSSSVKPLLFPKTCFYKDPNRH
jgi:hypothetical protein